jgi:hypothetical protein
VSKQGSVSRQVASALLVIVVCGLATLGSSCASTSASANGSSGSGGKNSASFGDGTFKVGTDIKPGTYQTSGSDGCYWERDRNFNGDVNSIIANGNPSGQVVVTIQGTDKGFTSTSCGNWTRVKRGSGGSGGGNGGSGSAGGVKASFGDGTFKVGPDIKPGLYITAGADGCYWERMKDFKGGMNSTLANDNAVGQAVVEIEKTDKGFTSTGCGTWHRTTLAANPNAKTSFGDGAWRVGADIKPGTYRSAGGSGCYWERERDFAGGLNSLIANNNASGPTIVTIQASDAGFKTNGCGTWHKG